MSPQQTNMPSPDAVTRGARRVPEGDGKGAAIFGLPAPGFPSSNPSGDGRCRHFATFNQLCEGLQVNGLPGKTAHIEQLMDTCRHPTPVANTVGGGSR
jgi:hypothetical protein